MVVNEPSFCCEAFLPSSSSSPNSFCDKQMATSTGIAEARVVLVVVVVVVKAESIASGTGRWRDLRRLDGRIRPLCFFFSVGLARNPIPRVANEPRKTNGGGYSETG